MVAVGAADEEAVEEAEEGELEPGERAASPEEEEMSAAEASNPQGIDTASQTLRYTE